MSWAVGELRWFAESMVRHLHDSTDETGFWHNCVAHPLWWLVCRPDQEPEPEFTGFTTIEGLRTGDHRGEPPASLNALLAAAMAIPANTLAVGDLLTVEGRFSTADGIIKSLYDSENFEHDATLLSIPDDGLNPDVLLTFITAAEESSIIEQCGTDLRRDADDRCPSCLGSVKPQVLSPGCTDPWHVT